jgi:hypothetical protein
MMKQAGLLGAAVLIVLTAAPACLAQDRKPEIVIPSSQQPSMFSETCVEVEIGGEKAPSLGCLNRRLKQQVDRIAPSVNAPPFDARSQDIHLGIANTVAVQQQYGPNYGRSAIPFRPPQNFVAPSAPFTGHH